MSAAAAPAELAVRRLRVVDRGDDALPARHAAERLLTLARPQPPGLPPGAVLVVRALALRAPREVGAAALARWRAAAEALLEARLRAAARPALEPVPADAPAVLFADRAELLACLLEDLAAGVAGARWWWRAELAPVPVAAPAVAARCEAEAAVVPAALELLAARGRAVDAVGALGPEVAVRIAVAVATAHAVRVLAPPARLGSSAAPAASAATPGRGVRERQASRGATAVGSSSPAAAAPVAPWASVAPEAADDRLAVEQRALLGLALTLRRDRPLARSAGFAPALARWWAEAAAAPAAAPAAPRALSRARPPAAPASAPGAVPQTEPEPARTPAAAPSLVHPAPAAAEPGAAPRPGAAVSAPQPDDRRINHLRGAENVDHRRPPASGDARPPAGGASAPALRTALGGLFLLLNLGLFLDLYGDFTRPRAPGIALDPWDFAALLGRELLPETRRPRGRLARDPAWRLLAELAGHECVDAPGAGFHPPRTWRTPPAWLAPFADAGGAWRWSPADDRLRVLHPAGFLALDAPAGARLARELARLGAAAPAAAPLRDDDAVRRAAQPAAGVAPPALARWVGWLAPYAAARLRVALGARTPRAAARTALLLPARVAVSPGRVDITIPLAALPLAVRRAGLDRTPGWIPATGRHLAIHFAA